MTGLHWRPLLVAVILAAFALLIACNGDDDDGDDDGDDDDGPPDAMSSASPDVLSSQLTSEHAGWRNADCFGCHGEMHRGGFLGGECVTCHGSNGAPGRPDGHATADCSACHAGSHAALDFIDEKHCTACHKFDSASACPVTEDVDVVVIGAGGGGLGAAVALAQAGLDVVLIEKHYKVGGYMTTFHRGDYTFEASLHAMGGFDEGGGTLATFTDLGIMQRIEPIKCDPMYRAVFPGLDVNLPSDLDDYESMLVELFPHEAEGIADLLDDMRGCKKALDAVYSMADGFSLEALFEIIRHFDYAINLLRYNEMTLQEMVEQYISDPQLIGLFTQLVTYVGLGPSEMQALFFMVMWNSYHLEGFYYIRGGSYSVSDALADVFLENGGRLRLNTMAEKIVIQDGRAVQVQTFNDACYNTRYVVSNANAPATLLYMVGEEYLPEDYVARVKGMSLGVATLTIFLGVDRDYTGLFDSSHEIMICEDIDNDVNFQYMFDGDIEHVPLIIANYTEVDPGNAPAGKNSITLTTYMPYDMHQEWRWGLGHDEYQAFKEEMAWALIRRAEAYLPGLGEHIEILEVGSPVTNRAFSLNPGGTIFGWANTVNQATLHRLQQQTPIENLYLAGAWTFPGGGQSAVIQSGLMAAGSIIGQEEEL